ncbi:hypothetical protein [Saccharomonospora sp. CUA-673]|nr:hypothetical protein [Saccharomonospora sp. CUA-673]
MAARWHETPRRERREDAGPGGIVGCAFVAFAAVYMGLHIATWAVSAVIA